MQSQTEPPRKQKMMTRHPFAGIQSAHGFQQTSSFQPPSTGRQETPRATRNSTVNGSNNKQRWGNPPPIQGKSTSQTFTDEGDAAMKGIKVPRGRLQTVSSSEIRHMDSNGVFHYKMQEKPNEQKRPREIISLDSVEGIPAQECTDDRRSFKGGRKEDTNITSWLHSITSFSSLGPNYI
jgi:hypothetical protein